jgi:rhodanese-related sulfurtransferase
MSTASTDIKANIERASASFIKHRSDDLLILDVRTPAEFEEAHLEESILQPLLSFDPKLIKNFPGFDQGCVLVCQSGNRARQAAQKLADSGVKTPLYVLDGGIQMWEAAGLPLIRGKKTISLERQVRIAAGSLVLTGALLAHFVNPLWIILSGFVGAGLVFAGITDTCGMGMLLARMPWNNRKPVGSCRAGKP